VFSTGNLSPCQMFIRCSPYGISLLPHGNNLSIQTQTSTVLQQLYRLTCVSRQLQLRTGGFCWCKVYCPHAPAAGSQCIWIRVKMLAFSTTVLSTLSPYHTHIQIQHKPKQNGHFTCEPQLFGCLHYLVRGTCYE